MKDKILAVIITLVILGSLLASAVNETAKHVVGVVFLVLLGIVATLGMFACIYGMIKTFRDE